MVQALPHPQEDQEAADVSQNDGGKILEFMNYTKE